MNCQNSMELFLNDAVGIDVVLADGCNLVLPPTIPSTSLAVKDDSFPAPVASIRMYDGDILMDGTPSTKATNARSAAGNIFAHEVQVTLNSTHEKAEKLLQTLQGADFHLIYIKANGSRSMSYSLPNTSVMDVEMAATGSTNSTIKFKMQSMSSFITLT